MKPHLLQGSRSRILAGIIFAIAAIFVIRLFYLQIIQHDHYVALAEQEQLQRDTLYATRGEIYALNGDKPARLVMNETVYTVYADPSIILDTKEVADAMTEIAGGNVVSNFKERLENRQSRYQIIANRVTRTQAEKIREEGLQGIGFQAVSQRVYPEGRLASQLLGFVNTEGKGNYGIEGYLNQSLTGTNGRLQTVTDVRNVPLTIGDQNIREPAVDGENVVLTIDRNVQSKVEEVTEKYAQQFNAGNISVLVMNPQNGHVMGMANYPDYDPAKYYEVGDIALFNNHAISDPYEPGSDIKTFTMATAIDKNVAHANDTFVNTDYIQVGDRTISNAYKGVTGTISFQTALNWSLNTGFVTLGMRLGNGTQINAQARETIYDYFHNRLGLGEFTGIELANESKGILIPPTNVDGNAVRYSNMTFGQGLDATMIQVTAGFSAMVNGGNYFKPTIIAGEMVDGEYVPNESAAPLRQGVVKETTSKEVRDMSVAARNFSFPGKDKAGYDIGGKTGTSQVIKNGVYADDETVGTYLGFGGGKDSPEYVIMVSVSGDHQTFSGGQHAMPLFTEVSNWLLDYLTIQPKG
jgi:cell division protein FtsI/penicillin-binding protein 2